MIVNVASVGGVRPSPFIGIYNASKAALAPHDAPARARARARRSA